jgi:hypothetical protein
MQRRESSYHRLQALYQRGVAQIFDFSAGTNPLKLGLVVRHEPVLQKADKRIGPDAKLAFRWQIS